MDKATGTAVQGRSVRLQASHGQRQLQHSTHNSNGALLCLSGAEGTLLSYEALVVKYFMWRLWWCTSVCLWCQLNYVGGLSWCKVLVRWG